MISDECRNDIISLSQIELVILSWMENWVQSSMSMFLAAVSFLLNYFLTFCRDKICISKKEREREGER